MSERKEWILGLTKFAARVGLSPFFRLDVSGLENLPRKSAFVLLPKHQRWEDIPLTAVATPRPLYYVAKYELFVNPLTGWYLTALGGIPLNRQRPLESRRSMKAVIEYLNQGEGIVVFPEGTWFKGKMGPGQSGMVRLILSRLSLPFIPVGINYSQDGRRILTRIKYGKAFYADREAPPAQFLEHMMKEIAILSGLY
jgi:1-acyl-sn-glycerol-3-phosphate acyltransferase